MTVPTPEEVIGHSSRLPQQLQRRGVDHRDRGLEAHEARQHVVEHRDRLENEEAAAAVAAAAAEQEDGKEAQLRVLEATLVVLLRISLGRKPPPLEQLPLRPTEMTLLQEVLA
jgi:hypothetical protein